MFLQFNLVAVKDTLPFLSLWLATSDVSDVSGFEDVKELSDSPETLCNMKIQTIKIYI